MVLGIKTSSSKKIEEGKKICNNIITVSEILTSNYEPSTTLRLLDKHIPGIKREFESIFEKKFGSKRDYEISAKRDDDVLKKIMITSYITMWLKNATLKCMEHEKKIKSNLYTPAWRR